MTTKNYDNPEFQTFTDFKEITLPATPGSGVRRFSARSDGFYSTDSTGADVKIGSGSGSGRNYFSDWFDATKVLGTINNGGVSATGNRTGTGLDWASTNTTNISITKITSGQLRETSSYQFSGSGNSSTGGTFIETPATALDLQDMGVPVYVSFDVSSALADGDWDVAVVRYNSGLTYQETIPVAGNASTATVASGKIPTGTVNFKGYFVSKTTATDLYALRFRRLAGTVNPIIDTLIMGPQQQLNGSAVGAWKAYTPTWSTVGSAPALGNGSIQGFYRENGDSLDIRIALITGTTTTYGSGGYTFSLPSGYTPKTSVVSASALAQNLGTAVAAVTASQNFYDGIIQLTGNLMYIIATDGVSVTGWGATYPATWSASTANQSIAIDAKVAVNELSANTTIMANNPLVEYVSSTTGTWDAAAAAGNTVYSSAGSPISGALTAARNKVCQFQGVYQAGIDSLWLEYQVASSGIWIKASDSSWAPSQCLNVGFGAQIFAASGNTVTVSFNRYANSGSTFNSTTGATDYASASYSAWRLVKVRGGLVAAPISARNVIGDTTGTVAPTGYIGEIDFSGTSARTGTGGLTYSVRTTTAIPSSVGTIVSLTLNKGVYLISTWNAQTNNTGRTTVTSYLTVGGTQVTTGNNQVVLSGAGGDAFTFGLGGIPVVITSDGTVVAFAAGGGAVSWINVVNEMFAVRIA